MYVYVSTWTWIVLALVVGFVGSKLANGNERLSTHIHWALVAAGGVALLMAGSWVGNYVFYLLGLPQARGLTVRGLFVSAVGWGVLLLLYRLLFGARGRA